MKLVVNRPALRWWQLIRRFREWRGRRLLEGRRIIFTGGSLAGTETTITKCVIRNGN